MMSGPDSPNIDCSVFKYRSIWKTLEQLGMQVLIIAKSISAAGVIMLDEFRHTLTS